MADFLQTFEDFINNNLNAQQKKAVIQNEGQLLVVAGAGSGKTRVITARIANLILKHNVSPQTIVALTFTNKAAKEMQERIARFLPAGSKLPFVGTFHSYCLKLLKKYANLLPNPFVSILDQDDKLKLISNIIKSHGIGKQTTAKKLSFTLSQLKNQISESGASKANDFLFSLPFIQDVYSAYEQEKKVSKCLDFDDLLIETVKLFKNNKDFQKTFQQNLQHILVDEYQDTNVVQHTLLKLMTLDENKNFTTTSLCVVGDQDQSIYSWRGATVENIVNFKQDFPKTKTIKIEQNYRSVQPILDAANYVIQNNDNRSSKKLWSSKKATNRIKVLECMSEHQEGDLVAQFLKTAQAKKKLSDVAILYRAHYQSRAIEEALLRNAIPYKIIGGIQFYERKEIKDILAHLRLLTNPFDRASFMRTINCPTRGLGVKFEELFFEHWNVNLFYNFQQVAEYLLEKNLVKGTKEKSLTEYLDIFKDLPADILPSDAIEHIIKKTGYYSFLKNSYDEKDALSRIDNIKELLRAVTYLQDQGIITISEFLDEVALMQEKVTANEQEEKECVLLMTYHAAKGLEFDTVILIGLEENLLPSTRSQMDSDALQEERRLFYVGITRAQEHLLLTHSKFRYTYGAMSQQLPSRFLQEIPQQLYKEHSCSHENFLYADQLFCQWLNIECEKPKKEVFTFGSKKIVGAQSSKSFTDKPKSGAFLWKRNHPVQHKVFGVGIIQKIEKKGSDKIYITAKFKAGLKKLDSKFLIKL